MSAPADAAAPPISAFAAVSLAPAPEVQWRSPERDLWVGRSERLGYAGMIERAGAEFVAHDARGVRVGSFDSLGLAEAALVELDQPEAPRGRYPLAAVVTAGVAGAAAVLTAALGVVVLAH